MFTRSTGANARSPATPRASVQQKNPRVQWFLAVGNCWRNGASLFVLLLCNWILTNNKGKKEREDKPINLQHRYWSTQNDWSNQIVPKRKEKNKIIMLNQKGTSSDARLVLDDPFVFFFFKMSDRLCFVLSHCSNRTVRWKWNRSTTSWAISWRGSVSTRRSSTSCRSTTGSSRRVSVLGGS